MMLYENYKVLIVDDELDILKSLNRDLRKEPYEKLYANTGEQALKFFESEEDIAVVITDMRMPGMNGLQLLERIHVLSPDTIKIVLTGYTQLPQILATVNKVDIYKFLTKPWDLENELKVYVNEGIELYQKRKEMGNQLKSNEQKTKVYNKMLIESYEKADFLAHLFEQFSHALNYHHIMSMQEIRTISPDEKYEESLHKIFNQMKERVYYMNQIYDMNKFGPKVFMLSDLEIEVISQLKRHGLNSETLRLTINHSKISYRDHLKFLTAVITDFLIMFSNLSEQIVSSEIGQIPNEIYPQIFTKITLNSAVELEEELGSKVKFIQQLAKNTGGKLNCENSGTDFVIEMLMPIKPEHSIF